MSIKHLFETYEKKNIALARIRLDPTRVKHTYLLLGEEQPRFAACNAPFTVRHFPLEYGDFS